MSVHGNLSDVQFLLSGVPQGSVLGPLVFMISTCPLDIVAQRYCVKYQLCADDTQLYILRDISLSTTILRVSTVFVAFLTQETLATVVHAFLTSHIDYYNSLLYGICAYNINHLQRIRNSEATIVTNIRNMIVLPQFFKNCIVYQIAYPFQDCINNI